MQTRQIPIAESVVIGQQIIPKQFPGAPPADQPISNLPPGQVWGKSVRFAVPEPPASIGVPARPPSSISSRNVVVEIDDIQNQTENRPSITQTDWCGIASVLLFKVIGLILYFAAEWIYPNKGKSFKLLCCIITGALDFWTTKNIAGRRLVGLMWKRRENPLPGKTQWLFACSVDESRNNSRNTILFWGSIVGTILFWTIFMIYNLITLSFEVATVLTRSSSATSYSSP